MYPDEMKMSYSYRRMVPGGDWEAKPLNMVTFQRMKQTQGFIGFLRSRGRVGLPVPSNPQKVVTPNRGWYMEGIEHD